MPHARTATNSPTRRSPRTRTAASALALRFWRKPSISRSSGGIDARALQTRAADAPHRGAAKALHLRRDRDRFGIGATARVAPCHAPSDRLELRRALLFDPRRTHDDARRRAVDPPSRAADR